MSKIALNCGHGTQTNGVWDSGTTYAGYSEAALMLPITKAAVKYLRSYGVTVISDSDKGNNRNMVSDVAWANKEGVQLYISVHCDWYKAGSGVYPLYVSSAGKKLATALNNAISKGMPMKSRGVCRRTDLYELNVTDMPAVILECGSIKADLKTFRNDYDKYGKLIAKGVMDYLGKKIPTKKEEPKETLYRVRKTWNDSKSQVGAYKSLDNAKAECNKHSGYSVYAENGKVLYTNKPKVVAKAPTLTRAEKIVAMAKKYCWAFGTAEKKWAYKTGSAISEYKTALKKYMGKSEKVSQSDCGYFVSTCVRSAGVSSTFNCLQWSNAIPSTMSVVFKGKKIPDGTLKAGDIIRYKKTSGSQHTMIYIGDGKIAEAGRKIRFPVIRKDTKKYNASNVKHSTLQVLRAK